MAQTVQLPAHGFKFRPYQARAWNKVIKEGKRKFTLVWHRRGGKDEFSIHIHQLKAMQRVGAYWHMFPTIESARRNIWSMINPHTGRRRILDACDKRLIKKMDETRMIVHFINGSTLQLLGSDNYDNLVGASICGFTMSEYQNCDPTALDLIMPMVEESNGYAGVIGTPRGKNNHLYKQFTAWGKNPEAFVDLVSAEHSGVFTPERLAQIKQDMINSTDEEYGTAMFNQEYLCSWLSPNSGAIIAQGINRARDEFRVGHHVQYDPYGSDIWVSMDLGSNDATTCWFWQRDQNDNLNVLSVLDGVGVYKDEWCLRIDIELQKYYQGRLGYIWLPHDSKSHLGMSSQTVYDTFIERFGSSKIAYLDRTPKQDRIEACRRITRRTRFSDRCEHALEQLCDWRYAKHKQFNTNLDVDVKNPARNFGDGYSYGCQIMEYMEKPTYAVNQPQVKSLSEMTANELGIGHPISYNRNNRPARRRSR